MTDLNLEGSWVLGVCRLTWNHKSFWNLHYDTREQFSSNHGRVGLHPHTCNQPTTAIVSFAATPQQWDCEAVRQHTGRGSNKQEFDQNTTKMLRTLAGQGHRRAALCTLGQCCCLHADCLILSTNSQWGRKGPAETKLPQEAQAAALSALVMRNPEYWLQIVIIQVYWYIWLMLHRLTHYKRPYWS